MTHEDVVAMTLYVRLVLYPLLSYSLVIYAYGPLYDKYKSISKITILFALVIVMLWTSSILYFLTMDNALVVEFNSFGLIPVLILITIYVWIQVCHHCLDEKREKKRILEESKND